MSTVTEPPRTPRSTTGSGHRVGTRLDTNGVGVHAPLPSRLAAAALFLFLAVAYFAIGYQTVIEQHVVVFDALDRLTRAYLVWHNDPPKLAAIGFLFPPLTTLVYLPLALVKPVATSLVALPLMSAAFAAATVVVLDRTLARCDMAVGLRLPLLALFAVNPFWVFYAGNGMSEAVYAFFLAAALYCVVSWYVTTEPRFLIGAGFALAFLVLSRYSFIVWALLIAVLIGIALARRHASGSEVEGSVIAYAAPIVYVLALWVLFNWLIVGEPLEWLTETATSQQAANASGVEAASDLSLGDVMTRLLELTVAIAPLALVAVPALVFAAASRRNDMAIWLALFTLLGAVTIGAHALIEDDPAFLTLRDGMPIFITAFVGAAWVYRMFEPARMLLWGGTALVMLIGLFTAWDGMKNYPYQSLEQSWTRAIESGDDQEGTSSRGGYTVGIESELQMANYIDENVTEAGSILTDNAQTFGVILLNGKPELFFDRVDDGDDAFLEVRDDPWGEVRYFLTTAGENQFDLIRDEYPALASGTVPGFTVVSRTDRYILSRVAPREPAAAAPTQEDETP